MERPGRLRRHVVVAAAAALLFGNFIAPGAHACSVCFGDPESPQTAGLNAAIGTLLGVTLVVLTGVALFGGAVMWRFARQSVSADPTEDEPHG